MPRRSASECFESRRNGIAQLAQRLLLDLANPLAGHGETLADFLQREIRLFTDSEPHTDDLLFARRECREHPARLLLEAGPDRSVGGRFREPILDEITKDRFLVAADRRLE